VQQRKVIFASSLGTVFEWHDFYIYGTLAAFLAGLFFPPGNRVTALVTTLLTFGVGFMVRPATDQLIAMLQGKIIGITGTIELYQGKPEIKVMSILEQTSL
jgi:hypothetical protein